MPTIQKFTIGIAPFAKMFRMRGMAGAACDAVLKLRATKLSDDYYEEVGWTEDRSACRLFNSREGNALSLTEDNIAFTKNFYSSEKTFSFEKALAEFKLIYAALHSVLQISDIRRVGMVAEHRYEVSGSSASSWLRSKLTSLSEAQVTEKFSLRFEERKLASDGTAPDPKKGDFVNLIYHYYDSAIDDDHPIAGRVNANLDVQRYFAPVLNGNVPDEILKLYRQFEVAQKKLDEKLRALGAIHAKG